MRTHSKGLKKLRPNKIKGSGFKLDKEKRWSVIGEQVKILGTLHSKTLNKENKELYIQELEKLKKSDWINAINKVKKQFFDYYNACKN